MKGGKGDRGRKHWRVERATEAASTGSWEGHFFRIKFIGLTDCIVRLIEESSFSILRGESISLTKTCGLVYKPANDNYTNLPGKCSPFERDEIRSDLERDFHFQLTDENNSWSTVSTCLTNKYGNDQRTTRVEEICLLVRNKTEICDKITFKLVEDFVSEKITSLHCLCKNMITASTIVNGNDHVYQEVSGEMTHARFQQSPPYTNLGISSRHLAPKNQSMMSGIKNKTDATRSPTSATDGLRAASPIQPVHLDDDGHLKPITNPVKATGDGCTDTVVAVAT
ncbi:hypothetical protein Btru_055171 [Bulinus truncatus]|nr:hypothetical protein Btru_055171 [Bulinus truncatus]